jgi:hypothetical protein
VRLWQENPELYLTAGLGLLPLAPLAAVSVSDLPGLVQRMKERIEPVPPPLAGKLWIATCLLMGLRYPDDLVMSLLEGVQTMHQSTTYERILREGRQKGLDEGRLDEARRFVILQGTERFGAPDAATVPALDATRSVEHLEALGRRMIVEPGLRDWAELLRES